ncbi:MAG: hypothetical protein LBV43_02380 [Prevotella sp.]|jgi:hypothetical protein|nr:hypothetical protein [Prevotella sp.]
MRRLVFSGFLFFFLLVSYACEDKEPFEVIYEVSVRADVPVRLTISYRDSVGRVVVYTDDRHWSKKVTRPADGLASLMVRMSYDPTHSDTLPDFYTSDFTTPKITGRIVHPNKTVRESSGDIVLISLLRSECRRRNIFRSYFNK